MTVPDERQLVDIAIIGAGLVGPRHAKSVRSCSAARLSCFVDPRPEAEAVARDFNVPIFCNVQQMLVAGQRPDAAIVCTPNHTHVSISIELLQSGIHVLVEKPMATCVEDAQHLMDESKASRCHLLVGHHRRFNPYVTATKQALVEGAIGRIIAVSGMWTTYKPDSYFQNPTEWRAQIGAGGPILINMIHEVDILQYLLGPIVRVHAEQTISQRGNEVEEGSAMLFCFASGVVGTFILSDATPSMHSLESGTGENPIIPRSGKDFYRILGTEGTLSVGDMKVERFGKGDEKNWTNALQEKDILVGNEVPFDEQVKHFVDVIKGRDTARCTGDDGLSALKVCAAAHQAMKSGQPVEIVS